MFGFAEDAEGVGAEDFFDVGFGVVAVEEFLGDEGVRGNVGEVGGDLGDAIVICAQADVVDAGDFDDVIDVVDEVFDGAGGHGIFLVPLFHGGGVIFFVGEFFAGLARDFEHVAHAAGAFGDDEAGVEVDHDDAAILFEAQEDVVGNVAGVLGDGVGGGVRGDDRRLGDVEDGVHGVGGDVGDVDEHAEAIHFEDYFAAESGEAVGGFGFVGGSVGPGEAVGVREGHVANAEFVIHAKEREGILDGMAAFDSDEAGDFVGFADLEDFVGGAREGEGFGIASDHAVDEVDLLEGLAGGAAGDHEAGGNVSSPELGAEAAEFEAGDVGVEIGPGVFGEVEVIEGHAGLSAHFVGEIVVAVDDEGFAVDAPGFGGDFGQVVGVGGGGERGEAVKHEDREAGAQGIFFMVNKSKQT